jgi:hypothetical protein
MSELAKLAIDAHGGLKRRKDSHALSPSDPSWCTWVAKGKAGVLDDVTVTVDLLQPRLRGPLETIPPKSTPGVHRGMYAIDLHHLASPKEEMCFRN